MSEELTELISELSRDLSNLAQKIEPYEKRRDVIEVIIKPENIRDVCKKLLSLGFDHFIGITAIDWFGKKENTFELIYMLSSIKRKGRMVFIRFKIPRDYPFVDSIHDIYPLAYYQEIEMYEFFGIIFRGHDGLKKWILEGNWEGPPPLRKDIDTRRWALETYYGGKRYERPK